MRKKMDQQHTIRVGKRAPRSIPVGAGRRTAMTLFETAVAAAMLAVFLVSATRTMAVLSAGRQASQRHALALQTASNLLEELSSQSWQALTSEAATDWAAQAAQKLERLPGAILSAEVVEETAPVAARKLTVSLDWKTPGGRPGAPIRLTAWVFPPVGGEPSAQTEPALDEPPAEAESSLPTEAGEP